MPSTSFREKVLRHRLFVASLYALVNKGLSFSWWFFFWFWKMMRVLGSALGLQALPRFPYTNEQASGGYIALCVIAIWASRAHLVNVLKLTLKGKDADIDREEPIRYRTAVLGLVVVFVFMIFFCYQGGGTVWITLTFFAFYYFNKKT